MSKSSLGVTLCVEVFLRVLHPPQNDQPEAVPLPQPTDTVFGEETQEARIFPNSGITILSNVFNNTTHIIEKFAVWSM